MTGRLALGLLLAAVAAACGSAPPTPAPMPTPTPASAWDPRRDEIDQAEGVWKNEQPDTYAYTSTNSVDGMGTAASRVTGIDGHVEVMPQLLSSFVADTGTIETLFDTARAALGGEDKVTVTVDQQYGYLSSIEHTSTSADGSSTQTITEFTTPGDHAAKARATDALNQLLTRAQNVATPAWEYRWTRIDATSADTPTAWVVRHVDGKTSAHAVGGTGEAAAPDAITIDGTVAGASAVIASGGWVDVAVDPVTGLDVILAIDPSPTIKGDGYWIRIDFTDTAAVDQRELLDAAKARWASAKLKKHTYTWAYDGERGAWSWSIAANGDVLKFLKRSAGAPTGDSFDIRPSIPDAFTAIGEILASGGTVSVTYDRALGYPRKIVISNGGTVAAKGTITITKLKAP